MSFRPNAKVKVSLSRPFPGPGFGFSDRTLMVGESVVVSGSKANGMKEEVEGVTAAPMDSFTFEVVEEGGGESLDDYIQSWRADKLREADITLEDARGMTDEELTEVNGIGPATAEKIPNDQ